MNEFDMKSHARSRRAAKMAAMWDGYDYRTKIVPSEKIYKRGYKHRPQNPYDWEELEE